MSTIIKKIKDFITGDTIYPLTKATAVYMNDDTTSVEGAIGELRNKTGYGSHQPTAYKGLNLTARKFGQVVHLHITGSTTSQLDSKGIGEVLFTLPPAYRPASQFFLRNYVTGTILAQCIIDTSGEIRFSYSANVSGSTSTNVDIPSGASIRFECCYINIY